ncbi:MAG: response regulator [Pseudomonadota bacterium]
MFEGRAADVLIVDDNRLNRKKLKLAVETLGYAAHTVEDGDVAIERLRDGGFDVVLLDLLMPRMDGFEVLGRVKADDDLRDLPVIVISDLEGEPESVSRAIELGAEDFLPKGFDPVILNARLRASLRKKHFRDQELHYFRRVNTLTDAAAQIEAGQFDETNLGTLEAEAQMPDPIGRLALVFQGMAREIHAREVQLLERIRLLQGSLLLALVAATSGLTPSLSRMAAGMGSTPLGMAVWVDVVAAALALSVVLFRGTFPTLTAAHCLFFAVWAFLVGIVQHVTVFLFAAHVEATYLTLVMALESLLVFCFAALTRMERTSLRRIGGLLVGFLGIGVGLYSRLEGAGSGADLWLFGALLLPVIFAVETLTIAAKRPADVDPLAAVGLMFAFAILFAVPLAWLSGQWIAPEHLLTPLGVVILLLALVSIAANVAFVYLLDLAGAVFASQAAYATALAGIVWGMLLLGERMSVLAWVAIALVLLGMYLVETKGSADPIKIKRLYRR